MKYILYSPQRSKHTLRIALHSSLSYELTVVEKMACIGEAVLKQCNGAIVWPILCFIESFFLFQPS